MKVCHLTSVHSRYDTRIFLKECRSLANAGYETALVVADGKGDEARDGVRIHDVGPAKGRIDRIRNVTARVLNKAISIDADIYHFHDPELIPSGLKLKRMGKRVIFDAHEDVPKQLLSKPYLNKPLRIILSWVFGVYEAWACKRFDAVVTATPYIRDKFLAINKNSVDINNFPLLGELVVGEVDWSRKRNEVCYIGGIASIRGIRQVVQAMAAIKSDTRLQLGGRFSEQAVERELKAHSAWRKVDELGFVSREGVRDILDRSVAGIVTFLPLPNHIDAQPNKMFEYMSAGVPVICSDFPLWKDIISGNDCGQCVDPSNPMAIARAIDYFIENPAIAKNMGENGQAAVRRKYNWSAEEKKLFSVYISICD